VESHLWEFGTLGINKKKGKTGKKEGRKEKKIENETKSRWKCGMEEVNGPLPQQQYF
jgi:hypothetical protein